MLHSICFCFRLLLAISYKIMESWLNPLSDCKKWGVFQEKIFSFIILRVIDVMANIFSLRLKLNLVNSFLEKKEYAKALKVIL